MPRPLEGRTVALAESRQLEELVTMLESEGATALRCPMLSILDAPDPAPVEAWLHDLIADQFAWVVLMTGEAVRRLHGFAERAGLRDAYVQALARTRTLTRGPKPVKALKEIGVTPTKVAFAPTTDGVIATLRQETLTGQTVGVTLFGAGNPALEAYLRSAGAEVRLVLAYIFAPSTDDEHILALIERLEQGTIDAIVFTSSPQVERVFEVAQKHGKEANLRHGLEQTQVAAVGPLVAEMLHQHQSPVHICPEQGWVMKNLVRQMVRTLGRT